MKLSILLPILVIMQITSLNQTLSQNESLMKVKNMNEVNGDFVPEWAKKVVWYQIFPERFRNSDLSNDPSLYSLKGSWPHDSTSLWQIHPWTSDWYKMESWEKSSGRDIWFNIQRRRYGGDLQGIIDKLDYLKELGIGAIYLNPVFEAPSLHKYDGATYHHIDPNFGPSPDEDRLMVMKEIPHDPKTWVWTNADKLFLKLIEEVHSRGMKIIIDGVFNHMGINSWAFKDILINQQNSKYKDWFSIKSWSSKEKGTKFEYDGWFGVPELPELKEDENGIVEGPRKYIFDITSRWMDPDDDGDPADGIDGWRLDVAFCVKHPFWKAWRTHLKSINPDAYITAEIVDPPALNKPYLEGDEFDAVMNYNFLFACSEYFIDEQTKITVSRFDSLLKELRDAYPECVSYVQQNLNNSHDTQRLLTSIVNKDKYKMREWGPTYELRKGNNPKYSTLKPSENDFAINKIMVIFQMTYVGAPYVYYGEEAGMWGANDPDCRKPMVWGDLIYEDEIVNPDQSIRPKSDKVEVNKDLFEHYKKLIAIRNDNTVLQLGDFKTLLTDNKKDLYAFSRTLGDKEIIVIINNSNSDQHIDLKVDHKEYYKDLLNKGIIKVERSTLSTTIDKKWGRILLKDYYK